MIELGVCGFGYSGSGAVLDLLRDYDEVFVADGAEMSFVFVPDGIDDLRRSISQAPTRHWSSDSAIRRFITMMKRKKRIYNKITKGYFENAANNYINKIIQISWKGYTGTHYYQSSRFNYWFSHILFLHIRYYFEKLFRPIEFVCPPQITMYYSYMDDKEFVQISKEFLEDVLNKIVNNRSQRIVAIDQFFNASNPSRDFCYFNNPKCIVVLRDPRDTYLLAKKAIGIYSKFIPVDTVLNFIVYYRGLMKSFSDVNNKNVLQIQFEDLIYNHQRSRREIENFLGLTSFDPEKESCFKPQVSINNTQLWKKYPLYKKDIEIIESELAEYLYSFDKYNIGPTFKTNTF